MRNFFKMCKFQYLKVCSDRYRERMNTNLHDYHKKTMQRAIIDDIKEIPTEYPSEFISFCKENSLKYPQISSNRGKCLTMMLHNPDVFWDRETCNAFVEKFKLKTGDSIQLFNKHAQWGIKTSSEMGKYYITYPFQITNKHKMRKNFRYDGTEQSKNDEIDNIKKHIHSNYIEPPPSEWQLGHKNPESTDNSVKNLVLQPPIQSKYRDKYIFIDTLTKMPTPKTLIMMQKNGECPYTLEQLLELKEWVNKIV